jgi:hypothetical protein
MDAMAFLNTLQRALFGRSPPSPETVQRRVLMYLEGNGETEAATLYERIDLPGGPGSSRTAIDQAAQILVNTRKAEARDANGHQTDPVYAGGAYRLRLPPSTGEGSAR